ncbi:uncharacterized protein LOC129757995 [Uranotaenia lowii]|uniref:uncharacterized protein LOC129757995 n=1 Tax=Uranotaenia lowii TaxID=190385 RepID=UPI0024788DC6|nr:uncharacterized protein LOC129757995 [Uranotaenia lowii]
MQFLEPVETSKETAPPTAAELKKLKKLEKKKAKQRAAEEKKKQHVRDHLKREQQFTLETEKRVFGDWEKMCSDVKFQVIREELEQIMQGSKHTLDRKNVCIDRLLKDREEIEDVYSRNLHRLKRLIEYYLEMHKFFIEKLSEQYKKDCRYKLDEFNQDISLKSDHQNDNIQQMEGALYSLEDAMQNGLHDDRIGFIKKNDGNINFHIEKRDRLRDHEINKMEALHSEIQSIVDNYFATILHPEKEKAFNKLYSEDEKTLKLIDSNRKKMKEYNRTIKVLHKRVTEVEIDGTRKILTRRHEKRILEQSMDELKLKLIKLNANHFERMKIDSYDVHQVLKHLNALLERGSLILALAKNCSQYECESDEHYFRNRVTQGHTGQLECPPEFEFMFEKINRVKAITILQKEERNKLQEENRKLQEWFKTYCGTQKVDSNLTNYKIIGKTLDGQMNRK